MGTVGFALIVRDAAETLGVCLKSIEGLWDQLVVVDTGSTDQTVDIARSFGAEIHYFQWIDDFAAARNFSWDQLKTQWAFWVDGDDLFVGREYFDELVRKVEDAGVDGAILEYFYSFDTEGARLLQQLEPRILGRHVAAPEVYATLQARVNTTQWRERLVRLDPAWRWAYPIHEALPAAGRRLGKYDRIKIIHRRHVRSRPIPSRRNLDILLRVPPERRDERIWFYLGMEWVQHGDLEASIQGFEQYLPCSTVPDEKYLALHYLADLHRAKGLLERALEYDLRAVQLRPTWRDAYAGLLETCVRRRDWASAVYYGALCERAEIPDTPFAYNPMHETAGWLTDYVQALVEVGQLDEAIRMADRLVASVPEDQAARQNLDTLSVAKNLQAGEQALAHALEFFLRHDDAESAALLASRVPAVLRRQGEIRQWIEMVDQLCGVAVQGQIPRDVLKPSPSGCEEPGCTREAAAHDESWWWDLRVKHLVDVLGARPEVQTLLQVGGPLELASAYQALGLAATRAETLEQVTGSADAVVLWSCLERVQSPETVVARARQVVRPGGWLFASVPNGPASKGLGPPRPEALRLRAYSTDTFRQVLGTTRLPEILPGWAAEAGDLWLTIPIPGAPSRPKRLAIVCPLAPEVWGPWSLERGIGGSEEAVIRLGRAFARRGHEVWVYGNGDPGDDEGPFGVVHYRSIADYQPADVLIGWRYPEIFMNQVRPLEATWRALWLHDSIPRQRVALVAEALDAIWCISDYHAGLYEGLPHVYKGRNGIDSGEFELEPVTRNPAKLVYVSTPFRGLDVLLESHWPAIKQRCPEAELHCYYGWESADRLGATSTPDGQAFKAKVMRLAEQPGVHWRGRVGQPVLYRELLSAGVWAYPTTHREEHCISAYLAQAAGAWPVVYPLGALPQSVVFGWKVGPEQFVESVCAAIHTETGRERMMAWARRWCSWDDVAAAWEALWQGREA